MWADVAEHCKQADLQLACAAQLAQRLLAKAHGSHALASGMADAAQLEGCSNSTLLLLLGLVTGAGRQLTPREQLAAYQVPCRDDITAAQQQAANPGSYEWRIEQFSLQPSQLGQQIESPWFMAGGRDWRLHACLNGVNGESAGHVTSECLVNLCGRCRASLNMACRHGCLCKFLKSSPCASVIFVQCGYPPAQQGSRAAHGHPSR